MKINLDAYPEIKNPAKTVIYYREFPDQALFLALPTTYDSSNKQLLATTTKFGEFVFGETGFGYTAHTPLPFAPEENQVVLNGSPVSLSWTGQGFYDSFIVQVADDSLFASVVFEETLNLSSVNPSNLQNNTTYFWRVRSILPGDSSTWSPVLSFITADPFISINIPSGEELWSADSTEIIRWETNIADSVLISLYQDDQYLRHIGETVGALKAIKWTLPSDITTGDNYKVKVTSKTDSLVNAMSSQPFSIEGSTGIEEDPTIATQFNLQQNYPNPFNPSTTITFNLPSALHTTLKIYDVMGREVLRLLEKQLSAGRHTINFDALDLPSGIYFYRFEAGTYSQTMKMMLLK